MVGEVASSKTKSILGVVSNSSLAQLYNGGCIVVLLRCHFCVFCSALISIPHVPI